MSLYHVCAWYLERQEENYRYPEIGVTDGGWVLGCEPQSSKRADSGLNLWALSPLNCLPNSPPPSFFKHKALSSLSLCGNCFVDQAALELTEMFLLLPLSAKMHVPSYLARLFFVYHIAIMINTRLIGNLICSVIYYLMGARVIQGFYLEMIKAFVICFIYTFM